MSNREEALFTVAERDDDMIIVAEEDFDEHHPIMPPRPETQPSVMPVAKPLPVEAPKAEEQKEGWLNTKNPKHFTQFLMDEVRRIPQVNTTRGNEALMRRTLGQLQRLNKHLSSALQDDYDNDIDVETADKIRQQIERNADEIEIMLEGLETLKKNRKKMRRGEEESSEIVKEAGTPVFTGLQCQITAFERAVVGALINGTVSQGRDMEELYAKAEKKYDIKPREKLAIVQILADMGYPIFKDRLRIDDEDVDTTKTEGHGEWSSQYHG